MKMLQDQSALVGGPEEMFMKHSRFAFQQEYRLLWCIGRTVEGHLHVTVPEARQFCRALKV
jgi:hypothetical protein